MIMRVNVRGKNIELTDPLRQYVEKKLTKLEKYFDNLAGTDATVTLNVEKGRHIVEVTIPLNGIILRGEEATGDMYASVDLVVEKLEKQVMKYKTRLSRKRAANHVSAPVEEMAVNAWDEDEKPKIVRTKRFAFKPMPVEEAIMQMDLLGHDFFVFSNAATEEINVVYRRKDGNYGLIEPEF